MAHPILILILAMRICKKSAQNYRYKLQTNNTTNKGKYYAPQKNPKSQRLISPKPPSRVTYMDSTSPI